MEGATTTSGGVPKTPLSPFTMSSRGTGTSSFKQTYCCLRREPQPLCRRLKEIARLASVAV